MQELGNERKRNELLEEIEKTIASCKTLMAELRKPSHIGDTEVRGHGGPKARVTGVQPQGVVTTSTAGVKDALHTRLHVIKVTERAILALNVPQEPQPCSISRD